MPYYRIIVYLKDKKPLTGIRHFDSADIERIYRMCYKKAEEYYRGAFVDIEVQMLSKISTAVKKHLEAQQKKKDNKHWPEPKPSEQIPKRKDQNKPG